MKKLLVAGLVFASALFASSRAEAVVDVEARYWFSDFDSTVQVTNGAIGTEFDLVDDTGVDDKKNFAEGRIRLEFGDHSLRYAYVPLKWDGSKTLNKSITFGGTTYAVSTPVESELKLDYHRLGYQYNFIDTLNNKLGVIFEVKYFDGEARLKATSSGIDKAESFKVPLPTVGLAAQVGLPFVFSVGAEVTGVGYSGNYLVDGEAGVNIKPAPFVVITAGYRLLKLKIEQDDDKADVTVKGPFVQLRADF